MKSPFKRLIPHISRQRLGKLTGSAFLIFTTLSSQGLLLLYTPNSSKVAAATPALCANPGNDGVGTPSGTVNTYYPGSGTASAGATSISVGTPTGAATAIKAGDLLLVIQMQDATINSNNTSAYGANNASGSGSTNLNSSGLYEYVVATGAVSGGSVQIKGAGTSGGLLNTYTSATASASQGQRSFQVVRVPQYSSVTTLSSVTAAAWNGATGGIVAVDVAGSVGGGSINVSGQGFRGGGGRALSGGTGGSGTDYRNVATNAFHGAKGEGIAGTPRYVLDGSSLLNTNVEGYPNGSTGQGAPGNAGGGGTDSNPTANDQNSGGGGGSNAGAGGKGGNAWSSSATVGGIGGAAFSGAANRLVLGGGGGAGSTNNATGTPGSGLASSGAVGGGIVMLRAGTLSGVTIAADGANANNFVLNDGSGGGGAGGSVLVSATSASSVTVSAKGGTGGTNTGGGALHGPGGGGGGGFVAYSSNFTPSATVTGGANGTTTSSNSAFGATAGSLGQSTPITSSQIPGAGSGAECLPSLTVTKTTSTSTVTNTTSGTTATYTITVANAAGLATAENVSISDPISDTLPSGVTYVSNTAPVLSGGATRTATTNPTAGATNLTWGTFSIPGGGSVAITFTVNIPSGVANNTYQNSATATYKDPIRTATAGTATATYDSANTGEDVTITAPDLTITKTHSGNFTQGQTGATYTVTAKNSGSAATSGTVTVSDTLPTGLIPVGATGNGWTCNISGQTVTCTRSDALAAGSSYPAITLTVSVAANAASPITNIANVSGGGEIKTDNNSIPDPTTIDAAPSANTSSCPVQYQEIYSGGNSTIAGVQSNSIYAIHVDSGAAAALTTQALNATPNSLATDHNNRLVYYAAGTSLYAWDVITNTHITITSNISSFASGIKDLSGGGAAFYNGSLYLGVDNPTNSNANNPRAEIYKVNFVSGSNGRTIQSVTPIGLSSYLPVNANWGDFIISNSGVIYGSTGNNTGGLWKFDLNTNTFTTLNSTFEASQLAKSSDGRLWAIGPSTSPSQTIQQLDPATGALTGTAKATTASADGAECVRGISTIGDRVWNDLNGNGTQDTGEPGIANITVALYRDINGNGTIDAGDPLLATQTTDTNGNYDFIDLVLGTYIVKVTDANNVLTGKSLTGGTNPKAVTLGSQQDFNNADFGYKIPPNLLLVKRITAINGNRTQNPNDGTLLNTFVNDPSTADDNSNWADRNTYLIGAFNGGKVKPGDEVEYTIYFLNTGAAANNVTVCDRIPDNMTLVPTGYNAASPHPIESGAIPSDTGIGFALDGTTLPTNSTVYLTNVNDSDRGYYYEPNNSNTPVSCKQLDTAGNVITSGSAANTNGAVVVDVVKGTGTANQLPSATAPGTPANSYGFIRFKAKVK